MSVLVCLCNGRTLGHCLIPPPCCVLWLLFIQCQFVYPYCLCTSTRRDVVEYLVKSHHFYVRIAYLTRSFRQNSSLHTSHANAARQVTASFQLAASPIFLSLTPCPPLNPLARAPCLPVLPIPITSLCQGDLAISPCSNFMRSKSSKGSWTRRASLSLNAWTTQRCLGPLRIRFESGARRANVVCTRGTQRPDTEPYPSFLSPQIPSRPEIRRAQGKRDAIKLRTMEGRVWCRRSRTVRSRSPLLTLHRIDNVLTHLYRNFDFNEKAAVDKFYPQYYHKMDIVIPPSPPFWW